MSMIDENHLTELHQCFACQLKFHWRTELEHHISEEHPEVHVTYVARAERPVPEQREERAS